MSLNSRTGPFCRRSITFALILFMIVFGAAGAVVSGDLSRGEDVRELLADSAANLGADASESSESIALVGHDPLQGTGTPYPRLRIPVRDHTLQRLGSVVVPTVYGGATPARALAAELAQPTSLASGDFDEDGVKDLVCGYVTPDGSAVTLHRGNVDAIFPHAPEARERLRDGSFTDAPFLSSARVFAVPARPEFLAAGDFDNDGHQDLVLAPSGGTSLYLLAGNGRGELRLARRLDLPGAVTALVAGEINRADGLADLVVGVRSPQGGALLIYEGLEGALRSVPEVLPLPAAPEVLLLGRLLAGSWHDLAAAAGDRLWIVRGRDRRLVLGEAGLKQAGPQVVDSMRLPSAIEALSWGDFAWEPVATPELALLLDDGSIRLMIPNDHADGTWKTIGRRTLPEASGDHGYPQTRPILMPARLSGSTTQDLIVLGAAGGSAQVLAGMVRKNAPAAETLADPGAVVRLSEVGRPIAALPMRLNRDALTDLVLLQPGVAAPTVATAAPASTITVDTAADTVTASDTWCSLREAIKNANGDTDTTFGDCTAGSGTDTIAFNIGGGGATATIPLVSGLPTLTDTVTIDGTTQGCPSPPCVVLDGSGAGFVAAGLHVAAGSSVVRGMVIHRIDGDPEDPNVQGYGIYVTSDDNLVEGNYIGVDATGTVDLGNSAAGVRIDDASDNTIGGSTTAARNVISGSGTGGVGVVILRVIGTASGNHVIGNYIGTDATGTADLGNQYSGIGVTGSNNFIGGTGAGEGNLSSGNNGNGIYLMSPAAANLVLGNIVGTDVSGTTAIPNGENYPAIWISGVDNTVGGTSVAARNLSSGNGSHGVHMRHDTAKNNLVLGNFIGTDVSGTLALGNETCGVVMSEGANNNIIGGVVPGARNISSGNVKAGVRMTSGAADNLVLGNFIGTDVTGTVDLGNLTMGVQIRTGAVGNEIGGTAPWSGNLISGNESDGVYIHDSGTANNKVLGNLIGTDVTGTVDLGNTLAGVEVDSDASSNQIGGAVPGAGNLISGNELGGVLLETAHDNLVQGNLIGTDVTGLVDLGNTGRGVRVQGSGNTIGGTTLGAGNVISGNDSEGILIWANPTPGNEVLGNFIGTDVTGTVAMPNASIGVWITDAPDNVIGGTDPGARNVISGNLSDGIFIADPASVGNQVLGNFIGTDVTGTQDLGNLYAGVEVQSGSDNTIGGTDPGARNIISGNDLVGVLIEDASQNVALGNFIGTDFSGTVALGNRTLGVWVAEGSNNTIGGTVPEARNVISGNGTTGILLDDTMLNKVQGNFIGTQPDGVSPLGNVLHGVALETGASRNTIGGTGVTPGTCDGPCNRIAFAMEENFDGVRIQDGAGTGNSILGNAIFNNGSLGIDLGPPDVTPNDLGDPDTGANNLQNYPVLTSANGDPSSLLVEGTLNSNARQDFRVELFGSSDCDSSGCGEGSRYLGFTNVTTDASGNASFSVSVAAASDDDAITATATALVFSVTKETSEFSDCLGASCLSTAVFGQTMLAADRNGFEWPVADHVRFVKGPLADVGGYLYAAAGERLDATSLDISVDNPSAGHGLFYLVRSVACGSWQTGPGMEPSRDGTLP